MYKRRHIKKNRMTDDSPATSTISTTFRSLPTSNKAHSPASILSSVNHTLSLVLFCSGTLLLQSFVWAAVTAGARPISGCGALWLLPDPKTAVALSFSPSQLQLALSLSRLRPVVASVCFRSEPRGLSLSCVLDGLQLIWLACSLLPRLFGRHISAEVGALRRGSPAFWCRF